MHSIRRHVEWRSDWTFGLKFPYASKVGLGAGLEGGLGGGLDGLNGGLGGSLDGGLDGGLERGYKVTLKFPTDWKVLLHLILSAQQFETWHVWFSAHHFSS